MVVKSNGNNQFYKIPPFLYKKTSLIRSRNKSIIRYTFLHAHRLVLFLMPCPASTEQSQLEYTAILQKLLNFLNFINILSDNQTSI